MVGIGFFAPFPLALMVPFMAGQSLAMGEAFGKGFQYGKRKISSMSNEEFNALDFKGLSESIATDYKVMIPSITKSIEASDELQRAVFRALADVIKEIPGQILDFFGDVSGGGNASTSPSPISEKHIEDDIPKKLPSGSGVSAWALLGINSLVDIWHYLDITSQEFKDAYHPNALRVLELKSKQALLDLERKMISDGAYARYQQRTLVEENKGQGKLYTQLVQHGYKPTPPFQLMRGASSKRPKSQSAFLKFQNLGKAFNIQYGVATQLMQLILNNPAESGPRRLNLRTVVIPHLNNLVKMWRDFGFTYQYL